MHQTIEHVKELLKAITEENDFPVNTDDIDLDAKVKYDDVAGATYTIGDSVEISDLKHGFTGKPEYSTTIVKFCKEMVRVKMSDGSTKLRKYKHIRHFEGWVVAAAETTMQQCYVMV